MALSISEIIWPGGFASTRDSRPRNKDSQTPSLTPQCPPVLGEEAQGECGRAEILGLIRCVRLLQNPSDAVAQTSRSSFRMGRVHNRIQRATSFLGRQCKAGHGQQG